MTDLAGVVWSIVVAVLVYGAGRALMPELASLAPRRRTVPVAIEGGRTWPQRRRVER